MIDKKENKKYKVIQEGCISCGACTAICPKVFKFDETNKSHVYHQPSNLEESECANSALEACPVKVIIEDVADIDSKDNDS